VIALAILELCPNAPSNLFALLHDKSPLIVCIKDDVTTIKERIVVPQSHELGRVSDIVILGEDVEERNFLDASTRRVTGNGANVNNAQAGTVVELVRKKVLHVLVVIDGDGFALPGTRKNRLLERGDIPDEGRRMLVRASTLLIHLVKFVVHEQERLVVGVKNPALMGVSGTVIRGLGDDVGGGFVCDVVDGKRIFILAVANFCSFVFLVGAVVDQALRIVNVSATHPVRLGLAMSVRSMKMRPLRQVSLRG
jgi:hypothetical protein